MALVDFRSIGIEEDKAESNIYTAVKWASKGIGGPEVAGRAERQLASEQQIQVDSKAFQTGKFVLEKDAHIEELVRGPG